MLFSIDGRDAKTIEYDLWHGYAKFEREGITPAFPFGFGLSYTTFAYADLTLSAAEFGSGLTATVSIRNTGKSPGRGERRLPRDIPALSLLRQLDLGLELGVGREHEVAHAVLRGRIDARGRK